MAKRDEPVRVNAYAGARGEEVPRSFFSVEQRIQVEGIRRAWVEEGIGNRMTRRFFEIDGSRHLLYYDEGQLVSPTVMCQRGMKLILGG